MARRLPALLLLLGALLGASAAHGAKRPAVQTVTTIEGDVSAFAFAGTRIAWIEEAQRCTRRVWVQSLRSGRRAALDPESSCGEGEAHARFTNLVFDGSRAVWTHFTGGNTQFSYSFLTAAVDDRVPRQLGEWRETSDIEAQRDTPPLSLAGAQGALVYYGGCASDDDCRRVVGRGIYQVRGRRSVRIVPAWPPRALAAAAGRVASLEAGRRRYSCGCSAGPTWSPDGRTIAFARGGRLHLVAADGTGLRALGRIRGADPDWSPDGRQIAVSSPRGAGNADAVSVIEVASGSVREVGGGTAPAWAPDGSTLAVVHEQGSRSLIELVDPRSATSQDLWVHAAPVWDVAWSPDGSALAIAADDGTFVITLANASETRVFGPTYSVDWSPHGDRLLVASQWDEAFMNAPALFVLPVGGGTPKEVVGGSSAAVSAEWAPDGGAILFASDRLEDDRYDLFVAGSSGESPHPVFPLRAPEDMTRVTTYTLRSGRRLGIFRVQGHPIAVALSSTTGVALVQAASRSRFYVFDPSTGRTLRRIPAPRGSTSLTASGRTLVYATGHRIHALDTRSGTDTTLAVAMRAPSGLTSAGGRVLWAEPGLRRTLVRGVTLR